MARPGRCWFCGEPHLRIDDPPEHVIPAAIGGTLETDRIGESCNREMGKTIDKPLLDDSLIGLHRAYFDVRDPRRLQERPPPVPRHKAKTREGQEVLVEMRDGEWHPVADPKPYEDETTFRITTSTQAEAEQIVRKKAERLGRQGIEIVHRLETVPGTESLDVTMEVSLDALIRARAVAKMTLATLSLILPDDWLDTPDAARLLSWLRDDDPRTSDGQRLGAAVPVPVGGVMKNICRPPEHLVVSIPSPRPDTITLWFVLFGKELLPQQVALHGAKEPEIGWAMDPKSLTLEPTSLAALVGRVAVPFDPFD